MNNSKSISKLFDTSRNNINMHLKEIYKAEELEEYWTRKDFLMVQYEGNRKVEKKVKCYSEYFEI